MFSALYRNVSAAVLGFGILAGISATSVEAAPVSISITSVAGTWGNITGGPTNLSNVGNTISWGDPAGNTPKSSYVFDRGAPPTQTALVGQNVRLGTFIHNNYPVYGNAITGATLMLAISGSITDGVTTTSFTVMSNFGLKHIETTNNYNPPSDPRNNDIVSFVSNAGSKTLTFAGMNYMFGFSAFEVDGTSFDQFSTVEGRSNSATFVGKLTAVATPGPIAGAGIPALIAFAGLFGCRRWLTKGAAA